MFTVGRQHMPSKYAMTSHVHHSERGSVISDCLVSHAMHIIRLFILTPLTLFFRPLDVIAGRVDETSLLIYLALLRRKVGVVNCVLVNASKTCGNVFIF